MSGGWSCSAEESGAGADEVLKAVSKTEGKGKLCSGQGERTESEWRHTVHSFVVKG